MAQKEYTPLHQQVKELVTEDTQPLRELLQKVMQETLEAEMDKLLGAERYERTSMRTGYRSGYYERTLITRVGPIELRVPQDRDGRFSTEIFERYQRSEKALVSALAEMYVQGVSTRKVTEITEALCGQSFSASTISRINKTLDAELAAFANRPLEEEYPYLILDARYEKVREDGVVRPQAVLVALGVNGDGRRCVLAVEIANRESTTSWRDLLLQLKERGLRGVEFVVSDDHEGLKQAIAQTLPEAVWQRCYVHFLRNALDHLPRKADDDCLTELRWLYDRRDLDEARQDLAAWLSKWQGRYSKLCDWVEENIEDILFLSPAPPAPQAPQVDQLPGAAKPGDQAAHACGAHLSQHRQLPAAGASAGGGDPRGVDRGHAVLEHGTAARAQEADAEGS
jgi:transposase-like protein